MSTALQTKDKRRTSAMRAEMISIVDEIKQAISLLRRHL
jgi:hypothetical protein